MIIVVIDVTKTRQSHTPTRSFSEGCLRVCLPTCMMVSLGFDFHVNLW